MVKMVASSYRCCVRKLMPSSPNLTLSQSSAMDLRNKRTRYSSIVVKLMTTTNYIVNMKHTSPYIPRVHILYSTGLVFSVVI